MVILYYYYWIQVSRFPQKKFQQTIQFIYNKIIDYRSLMEMMPITFSIFYFQGLVEYVLTCIVLMLQHNLYFHFFSCQHGFTFSPLLFTTSKTKTFKAKHHAWHTEKTTQTTQLEQLACFSPPFELRDCNSGSKLLHLYNMLIPCCK